ncbi:hypothetical protein CMI42_02430 [Candidatus Pacearchaeota archaeon]|jgi:hypothetical protein|nr:hypothetical protein [Candidatus Pacearchaeota archaeon]
MGKSRDIESISNSLSNTILHKILVEHTNEKDSILHLQNEEDEYRNQSLKKVYSRGWNSQDKMNIESKVINKVRKKLKTKYPDISIPENIVIKNVNEEMHLAFGNKK